jgi:hypothetical protein
MDKEQRDGLDDPALDPTPGLLAFVTAVGRKIERG